MSITDENWIDSARTDDNMSDNGGLSSTVHVHVVLAGNEYQIPNTNTSSQLEKYIICTPFFVH
jgi:hypothetical protein